MTCTSTGGSKSIGQASIFPKNIHFFATLLEHVGQQLQCWPQKWVEVASFRIGGLSLKEDWMQVGSLCLQIFIVHRRFATLHAELRVPVGEYTHWITNLCRMLRTIREGFAESSGRQQGRFIHLWITALNVAETIGGNTHELLYIINLLQDET